VGAEFFTFIAAVFEHLTFARLTLLAALLLFMAVAFNADKLAVLIETLFRLRERK